MKNDWQLKELGQVCEFSNGQAHEQHIDENGRYVVVNSKFISTEGRIFKKTSRALHLLKYEDIVMVMSDVPKGKALAKCFLVDKENTYTLNQRICVIRSNILNPKFLWYQLNRNKYFLSFDNGENQTNLRKDDILKCHLLIPPIPEQQRIVAILDKSFAAINKAKENAEKNLKNARALFESYLEVVFDKYGDGWVEKQLVEISKINYGYTESASIRNVGPKFLRITDIQNNGVDWQHVPYCPIGASEYPKYKLIDGDIVFARTGATTGKSYLVTDPPNAVFASYLIRVQVDTKYLMPEFVNLFFQTQSYWDKIRSGISGSAQGGFNATKLGELVIPFPVAFKKQKEIVFKADEIFGQTQRLESIYQRKLAALEELKKSILHKAFSGELSSDTEQQPMHLDSEAYA